MGASWTDKEPGYFATHRETARLIRRGIRLWPWVVGATLLTVAAAAGYAARQPQDFVAKLTLRVSEFADVDLPATAWTNRALRTTIADAAFTRAVLEDVSRRRLADLDPTQSVHRATENLRDSLGIDVIRAPDAALTLGHASAQSAYIVLTFAAPTAKRAQSVLEDLVAPIMDISEDRRRRAIVQPLEEADLLLEEAQRDLSRIQRRSVEAAGNPLVRNQAVLPGQQLGLDSAERLAHQRVRMLQTRRDDLKLKASLEKKTPGLNFEVVGRAVKPPLSKAGLILGAAIVGLLFGVPVWILVVGAFSPFIQSVEDLRRMGVPVLGHLHRQRYRG